MKRFNSLFLLFLVSISWVFTSCNSGSKSDSAPKTQYACPMHPEVTDDEASKCPKCGMLLEPVKKDTSMNTWDGKDYASAVIR
jgi:hypothetical protein